MEDLLKIIKYIRLPLTHIVVMVAADILLKAQVYQKMNSEIGLFRPLIAIYDIIF